MEMQAQDLTASHRGWEASTMAVSIQNHKRVILSQSPSENPATSTGNHQHRLETTATLIKNPPKPIARSTSWATHEPRSRPTKKKKKKNREEREKMEWQKWEIEMVKIEVTEQKKKKKEEWQRYDERKRKRKKEKYYFNEKERGWYKMLCGDCCVHDLIIFFWLVNRVSKTWFSSGRHVEKMPHHTWLEHWNRVSKTRFISPKSSLLDSRC